MCYRACIHLASVWLQQSAEGAACLLALNDPTPTRGSLPFQVDPDQHRHQCVPDAASWHACSRRGGVCRRRPAAREPALVRTGAGRPPAPPGQALRDALVPGRGRGEGRGAGGPGTACGSGAAGARPGTRVHAPLQQPAPPSGQSCAHTHTPRRSCLAASPTAFDAPGTASTQPAPLHSCVLALAPSPCPALDAELMSLRSCQAAASTLPATACLPHLSCTCCWPRRTTPGGAPCWRVMRRRASTMCSGRRCMRVSCTARGLPGAARGLSGAHRARGLGQRLSTGSGPAGRLANSPSSASSR